MTPIVVEGLKVYTVEDISKMLKVQEVSIRKWIREGKLRGKKIGPRWYVTEENLKAFFEHPEPAEEEDGALSHQSLKGADLSGANLSGRDLRVSDLAGAKLSGANLDGADLSTANLKRADLSGASLREAILKTVDLEQANLSHANLQGAYLDMVNLKGANLRGADLSDTHLRYVELKAVLYDDETRWPEGFDPAAVGATKVGRRAPSQPDVETEAGK